jgi:hypothetical protein
MARVSVLVPVHNAARFLPAALASLEAQTLPDFEVVLVDDGSTDGSTEVCRAFAERRQARHACVHHTLPSEPNVRASDACAQRVTVVRLEENGGVAAALNAGLAVARSVAPQLPPHTSAVRLAEGSSSRAPTRTTGTSRTACRSKSTFSPVIRRRVLAKTRPQPDVRACVCEDRRGGRGRRGL